MTLYKLCINDLCVINYVFFVCVCMCVCECLYIYIYIYIFGGGGVNSSLKNNSNYVFPLLLLIEFKLLQYDRSCSEGPLKCNFGYFVMYGS